MSDFDKEAEREKLREKYERDKKEREATQRMSDLLLKGATMTNAHCGTCGDPLFQQDETTFCPSCHGNPDAVQGTGLEAQPADESGTDAAADENENEGVAAADADTPAPANGADIADATNAANAEDADTPTADAATADESPSIGRTEDADRRVDDERESTAPTQREQSFESTARATRTPDATDSRTHRSNDDPGRDRGSATSATPATSSTDGDRDRARASLVRALEKWADEAATADDPRYATECLEAAREASETLNTLR